MSDIVERLRSPSPASREEAAAEIERLRAALAVKRDAEEQCLDAVEYVGRYNSGDRIACAKEWVRSAFTDMEAETDAALSPSPITGETNG